MQTQPAQAFPLRNYLAGRCLKFLVPGVCLLFVASSFATDRTWTGSSGYLWTVANNWSGNAAPVPGDNLIFPSGSLIPSNTTNTYPSGTAFGLITISEGNLQPGYVLAGNRVVLNGGVSYTGNLTAGAPTVATDVTLGADQVFSSTRGIVFTGRVDVNGHTLTLNPSSTSTVFFNGNVTNSMNNSLALIKTNAGTVVISAGTRVANVPVSVSRGTLRVDGALTNGPTESESVFIEAPSGLTNLPVGSAVLSGSGSVDWADIHDTISPGNNGPGLLHCNYVEFPGYSCGTFCFVPSGTYHAELNGVVPGTGFDQLEVYAYDLMGPPPSGIGSGVAGFLDVSVGYSAQIGDSFQILRLLPGNPFNHSFDGGVFAGLPPGCILDVTNGYSLGVIYSNGVTLTALRAPDSPFLLWKGNGTMFTTTYDMRNWSSASNWAQGLVPTNGARLNFGPYQYRDYQATYYNNSLYSTNIGVPPPQTNDLNNLSLASLLFTDSQYVFYGNSMTVTEGISNHVSAGTNICNFDIAAAGSLVLNVDTGGKLVLGGAFGGGGTLDKEGGGELDYTGTTASSFAGTLTLNNGTLRVDGALTDPSFTVNNGLLCGTGSVASVTMNGGTLNPGDGPGILHVQGNFNASAGATCQFDLNGATAGSGYDQVQVNGTVTLNNTTLNVQPNFAITVGLPFILIANDGSDAIVGTFAGLPEGAVFQAGGQYFSISYQAGAGNNDVVLTRVNPPPPPGQFSSIAWQGPTNVQLQGTGGTNANYTVQASTNLLMTNWLNIGTATANGSGSFIFDDTNAANLPQRFYRLRWP
jgi:fibronectin-binding autotransporter adhesin